MSPIFQSNAQVSVRRAALRPDPYTGTEPIITRTRKSWGAVSAVVTEVLCNRGFEADFEADRDQLVVMLAEVGGRVEMQRRPGEASPRPGAGRQPLSVIPAGLPVRGMSATMRFVRHLVLGLDLEALAGLHGAAIAPGELQPRLMFANPRLLRICELFAEACTDAEPRSTLYGDSLSLALLACLQDMAGAAEAAAGRGGLTSWQLRAAIQLMEENLESNFPLQTIADRVRLSCSHFSRGFRQSTGLAPHQWLIKARVARAQELLLETSQPLTEIALGIGFSDQAHFTRSFGKVVGTSPGAWRRAHRRDGKPGTPPAADPRPGAIAAYQPGA